MGLLEQQSELGNIELYYGDETQVSEQAYVPYGWQFDGEDVHIKASKGAKMNYFGLLSRNNQFFYQASQKSINAEFVLKFLL